MRKHIQKIFNVGVYIDKHRIVAIGFPGLTAVRSPERAENDYFLIIHGSVFRKDLLDLLDIQGLPH